MPTRLPTKIRLFTERPLTLPSCSAPKQSVCVRVSLLVARSCEVAGRSYWPGMETRAAYRTLARLARRHLGGAAGARPWLEHVAQDFRSSADLSAADREQRLQLASDYIFLVQHTHEHLVRLSCFLLCAKCVWCERLVL